MREAAAEAGRDPDAITVCVAAPAYVGDDLAHAREQCRWFGGMVGNHVADIVKRYGEGGDIPRALTDYIKAREGYDYSHHGRVGNPDTEFVPDEIVERFCVLGTVDDHLAKLRELEGLGVDQFNIYLMHDAQDATLDGLRQRRHPGDGRLAREHREQVADLLIARDRVGQRQLWAQRVAVAPPAALAHEVAVGDELADDPMRGALGDPDADRRCRAGARRGRPRCTAEPGRGG